MSFYFDILSTHPEFVRLVSQQLEPFVNVVGVEGVVLQAQVEGARILPDDVVCWKNVKCKDIKNRINIVNHNKNNFSQA